MEEHNAAVRRISAHLRDLYSRKEQFRIFHGSTNSTRSYTVNRKKMIDTSSLSHVINVDATSRTVLVEPNVPMDALVKATLAHGLVPPVVMEFPGITVGGGFSGTGGESSSFKYGSFDRIVMWAEIVLPDGEIVRASRTENADLFLGASGSLGTLGVATLFKLQLIEAKLYVEVTYTPFNTVKTTIGAIQNASSDKAMDYIDGILMSKHKGIVVTGRLTDSLLASVRVQRFTGASDPWFYIHADRITAQPGVAVKELVPLVDYLFRYDRGAFWMGKYAYKYFMMPFNRITRWALDDFMKTRTMYHALHASGHSQKYIIQDLALPGSKAEQFIDQIDSTFGFYPLWLCPLQPMTSPSLHPHAISDPDATKDQPLLINVGVWGPGANDLAGSVEVNRKLEVILHSLGGRKWLYAPAFYSEEEFWNIYDKKWYDDLRRKYRASHLPSAYDKASVDLSSAGTEQSFQDQAMGMLWSIWPMSGLYGVAQTLISKEYLLAK
ncbi:hypothetical protein MBLNU459_g6858t1 [Dothideomycetes sp. NU459]